MRAGEAWWIGREEQFSTAVDGLCPPSLDISQTIREATVRTGAAKEGFAFSTKILKEAQPLSLQYSLWKHSKMIELASEEAVSRANFALTGLEDHLNKFRSKVGNDLTSIKAASQRVQTEAQAMTEKYVKARDMLTSPDFEKAILNAERMATALEAIGRLSETKLSFAVFSGSNQTS